MIADPAVGFWHRFLVPNRSHLALENPHRFWDAHIAPHLDSYLGHSFETIVRQACARYRGQWGLPAATEWGRWEGLDRERGSVEIDLAARLEDGRLLAGELKWSASPHGPGLHTALLGKLARPGRFGPGLGARRGRRHLPVRLRRGLHAGAGRPRPGRPAHPSPGATGPLPARLRLNGERPPAKGSV
ncbi:MAG: hypothetical protein HY690_18595 [Chloroflexi bacterium]|nr:hypothetical protein [Chloroflexota bacterium]